MHKNSFKYGYAVSAVICGLLCSRCTERNIKPSLPSILVEHSTPSTSKSMMISNASSRRAVAQPDASSLNLLVLLRCGFYNPIQGPNQGECLYPGDGIRGARFQIDNQDASTKSGQVIVTEIERNKGMATDIPLSSDLQRLLKKSHRTFPDPRGIEVGFAMLPIGAIPDGDHTLRVIPPLHRDSRIPAGPDLVLPQLRNPREDIRLYRSVDVRFSVLHGIFQDQPVIVTSTTGLNHGNITVSDNSGLAIDIKPDGVVSPNFASEADRKIAYIVIHHTGGSIIGPAFNEARERKAPHYELDLDGHIVKYVNDFDVAWHAGRSCWRGKKSVNRFSIGIEITNRSGQNITEQQYTSLVSLVRLLINRYNIPSQNILAHADVSTGSREGCELASSNEQGDSREDCPGRDFDWARLEREGLGWHIDTSRQIQGLYSGVFDIIDGLVLRTNDNDDREVYGGRKLKRSERDALVNNSDATDIIRSIQNDLLRIGYLVKANGIFDRYTFRAVDRFQRHYFSGTRRALLPTHRLGQVDRVTADAIRRVAEIHR